MKKNIAVIFGGRSAEHDVSIITAHIPIIQSLLTSERYDVWPIYITREGSWYCDKILNDFKFFQQNDISLALAKLKKIQISFDHGLVIVWPGLFSKPIKIDLVFPALHGTFGEDGSMMGLLRLANVPFVGCDLFASAVAMDKVLTKQVLSAENIPIVPYVWFTKNDWDHNQKLLEEKISQLTWPLFVKPVHLGSSIAISKTNNQQELFNAVEVAFHYDDKVLVEESIEDLIEVTLPIIGNDDLLLAAIERPLHHDDFFNFDDKYLRGDKNGTNASLPNREIPAKIDQNFADQVKSFGQKTYHILGCSGIARIDFLIDQTHKKVYVNEVNTLPGSLYHHNFKSIGISNIELVNKLISLAEERFSSQQHTTYTFHSSILKKITSK